ncbi:cation:proton antiporter domain-containing protein [Coleofasciculus sp. G2-EDA-02]|uniref:cation:proton antiporter domain-containing protein n=1 Tax=Coleofasciculus sp. G2-EDA-02 TaxID=3069529 RepID=UPI0032FD05CC
MNQLNIAITAIAALVVAVGLLSKPLRRMYFSDSTIALLLGVLMSSDVLGWLDISSWWGNKELLIEEAARLTLAIGLMGVALRIPKGYVPRHWKSLTVILGLVMPLMWLSSGLLVWWLLDIPFGVAMLIGAVITPTDPVVSTDIVTGVIAEENIPGRLRHLISSESGLNDGLAYPIVYLPILFLTRSPKEALSHWLLHTILWEIGVAVLVAVFLGHTAGRLLVWAEKKDLIEKKSVLAYTIALSLLALGAAKLLGSDGILAVFITGLVFDGLVNTQQRTQEERIQEAVDRFFTLPIFLLLGLVMPWQDWLQLGWKGLLLVVAVLLLRRLPAILALSPWIKRLHGVSDSLFVGWFGPIGVAALYYSHLALRLTGNHQVWVVSSLMIFASILVHSISSTPLSQLYGSKHQHRQASEAH